MILTRTTQPWLVMGTHRGRDNDAGVCLGLPLVDHHQHLVADHLEALLRQLCSEKDQDSFKTTTAEKDGSSRAKERESWPTGLLAAGGGSFKTTTEKNGKIRAKKKRASWPLGTACCWCCYINRLGHGGILLFTHNYAGGKSSKYTCAAA